MLKETVQVVSFASVAREHATHTSIMCQICLWAWNIWVASARREGDWPCKDLAETEGAQSALLRFKIRYTYIIIWICTCIYIYIHYTYSYHVLLMSVYTISTSLWHTSNWSHLIKHSLKNWCAPSRLGTAPSEDGISHGQCSTNQHQEAEAQASKFGNLTPNSACSMLQCYSATAFFFWARNRHHWSWTYWNCICKTIETVERNCTVGTGGGSWSWRILDQRPKQPVRSRCMRWVAGPPTTPTSWENVPIPRTATLRQIMIHLLHCNAPVFELGTDVERTWKDQKWGGRPMPPLSPCLSDVF